MKKTKLLLQIELCKNLAAFSLRIYPTAYFLQSFSDLLLKNQSKERYSFSLNIKIDINNFICQKPIIIKYETKFL